VVAQLVPTALHSSAPRELEALSETLVSHLVEASVLVRASSLRAEHHARQNLTALLAAWPASDRTIGALLVALGEPSGGRRPSSQGGPGEQRGLPERHAATGGKPPLRDALDADPLICRGLQSLVQRARVKCAGMALETLADLLRAARTAHEVRSDDDDDASEDEPQAPVHGARRGTKRRLAPKAGTVIDSSSTAAPSPAGREAIERSARDALVSLKAAQPLLVRTQLPVLRTKAGALRE
jgi:hypothetical protein